MEENTPTLKYGLIYLMIAVIIGQAFFGVGGILILVPLTAVCYKLLREYVNRPKPTLPAGE